MIYIILSTNMTTPFTIREGTISEVIKIAQQIPEFHSSYPIEEYQRRLKDVQHLILVLWGLNKL